MQRNNEERKDYGGTHHLSLSSHMWEEIWGTLFFYALSTTYLYPHPFLNFIYFASILLRPPLGWESLIGLSP